MQVTFEHEEIKEIVLAEAIRMGIKVNYCNLKANYGNCTAVLEWVDPEPDIFAEAPQIAA